MREWCTAGLYFSYVCVSHLTHALARDSGLIDICVVCPSIKKRHNEENLGIHFNGHSSSPQLFASHKALQAIVSSMPCHEPDDLWWQPRLDNILPRRSARRTRHWPLHFCYCPQLHAYTLKQHPASNLYAAEPPELGSYLHAVHFCPRHHQTCHPPRSLVIYCDLCRTFLQLETSHLWLKALNNKR